MQHFDYIVVGSGAGGGPVACNLAEQGYTVLLLEAGGDDQGLVYEVPAYSAAATEDPSQRWDYWVRHYSDDAQQQRDSKFHPKEGGVLYPRAGTLGGCTAHNAMITVCPHNSDWDHIARVTGDESWSASKMRPFFQRLEKCEYILPPGQDPPGFWRKLLLRLFRGFRPASRANPSRHGFGGWLTTNEPDPRMVLNDEEMLAIIKSAAKESGFFQGLLHDLKLLVQALVRGRDPVERAKGLLDPNDWRNVRASAEGAMLVPLATRNGERNGTRERIRQVASRGDGKLTVQLRTLVTRVLFDGQMRATGVEYQRGSHLYRADPASGAAAPGTPGRAFARKEIILAGGTFNTPQLLMLSGVGPAAELQSHGIPVRLDLPGVGRHLQDRYEVTVVSELKEDFKLLAGITFQPPEEGTPDDPALAEWKAKRTGLYTASGSGLGVVKRSRPDLPEPDLFIFGLPAMFRGYYPGYSRDIGQKQNVFTWTVLKAHTNNSAGYVRLRSADPRDTPEINFKHFHEGNDAGGGDLEAVLAGVKLVRRMCERVELFTKREVVPGPARDSDEALKTWIRDEAWGHHACGTCRMGPESDPMAVVDGKLRVRGTRGLRVVDASVFPKIPGFFIVTPIYMLSEKISDDIVADANLFSTGGSSDEALVAAAGGGDGDVRVRDQRSTG